LQVKQKYCNRKRSCTHLEYNLGLIYLADYLSVVPYLLRTERILCL
jgi:hypothetical protein